MINRATIIINKKKHVVEVRNGVRYVDGMLVNEFLNTLDPLTLIDFCNIGIAAMNDLKCRKKNHNYQQMMDDFSIMRS